jgi:hypothetical protein
VIVIGICFEGPPLRKSSANNRSQREFKSRKAPTHRANRPHTPLFWAGQYPISEFYVNFTLICG